VTDRTRRTGANFLRFKGGLGKDANMRTPPYSLLLGLRLSRPWAPY
jgi:hypothetical protein